MTTKTKKPIQEKIYDAMMAARTADKVTINFKDDDKGKEEPVEGAIPSMILSAKVIRKRDHEYQPVVVGSKTDASTKSPKADSSSG
jgi:hypothetical protein